MKKRRPYYYIFCIAIVISIANCLHVNAQDLHYSQYFNAPLLVNPANTGFEPGSDWRVGANYRNQWSGVLNNPYQTFGIWGDAQVFNERFETGWVGLGGYIMRDVAGSGNLGATRIVTSAAYHQLLGYNSLLSGGFSIGAVNKRVDLSKLTFVNQWNGQFFDITIPSGETFTSNSVWYADLSLGLNYAYFPNDHAYLNAGISIGHVNRPNESFFSNSITDTRVAQRFNFFANASFKIQNLWIISPNMYYSAADNNDEILLGVNARYNLSGDGGKQVMGGMYYRVGDAAVPMVGISLNNFDIMINYDATTRNNRNLNQTRGAYEISLVKRGIFNLFSTSTKCPVVRF